MNGIEPSTYWLQINCSAWLSYTSVNYIISNVVVLRGGIEPPTRGFSVPCSTDWATEAKHWRPGRDSNPRPPAWQAGVLTICTTGPNIKFCVWWAFRDLNPGPIGYEPTALTNWAKGPTTFLTQLIGRGEEIRTPDPMVPNHVRYQAALHPDVFISLFILQYFEMSVNFFNVVFSEKLLTFQEKFIAIILIIFAPFSLSYFCTKETQ